MICLASISSYSLLRKCEEQNVLLPISTNAEIDLTQGQTETTMLDLGLIGEVQVRSKRHMLTLLPFAFRSVNGPADLSVISRRFWHEGGSPTSMGVVPEGRRPVLDGLC